MMYEQIAPSDDIRYLVEYFWLADSQGDATVVRQKIIPDGYAEIILHYGDPWRINMDGVWRTQSRYLLAGQIRNYFYLENTGRSGMIGIKFKPAALYHLFELNMAAVVDKVPELTAAIGSEALPFIEMVDLSKNGKELIRQLDRHLTQLIQGCKPLNMTIDKALDMLIASNGLIGMGEIHQKSGVSERQLERLFKKYVGLSPMFFSRIIRHSYIFRLMKEGDRSWTDIALTSGFFDQSHFIKNFREFTGENPSQYLFDDPSLANFFLKG